MAKEGKQIKIEKSNGYKVGICSVRPYLQDKGLADEFANGEVIQVTQKQFDIIKSLGWCNIKRSKK